MNGSGSVGLVEDQVTEWIRQHQVIAFDAAVKYCSQQKYLSAYSRLDNSQRVDWVCGIGGYPEVPDRYWWRMLRMVFDHEIHPGAHREFVRDAWDGITSGGSHDICFRPLMMTIRERRFLQKLAIPCTVWRGGSFDESTDFPGFCWTVSYDTAVFFAMRKLPIGKLFKATLVSVEDVCYFDGCNESEIFCVEVGDQWSPLQDVIEVPLPEGALSLRE